MNLNKLSDKERLRICRIYYLAGFLFLPFLWVVNYIWFFRQVFMRKSYPEQAEMKRCKLFGDHFLFFSFKNFKLN